MTAANGAAPDDGVVVEIEQYCLGALLRGKGLPVVRGFLREDHFLEDAHRLIYRGICEAFEQAGTTHLTLVRKLLPPDLDLALKARAELSLDQYLARLVSASIYDGSNGTAMAQGGRAVVEQSARIRFADNMDRAATAARDPSASVERLLQSTGSDLEAISSALRATKFSRSRMTIGEAGQQVCDLAAEAARRGSGLTGVTWGLVDVDRLTGGIQPKDVTLIGARPSMGKTSLMTSVALGAAHAGHGIGILSLEMDAVKLTARAISDLTHMGGNPVPYVDILRGKLDRGGENEIADAALRLGELPIEIDEAPVNTFDVRMKIEGMLERFEKNGWPALSALMIDHLGFIRPGDQYRGNRNNEIGEISRALKDYAKEYGLAMVVLSQLSREAAKRDNKRPILADLRDSGNLEQDADTVVFLHREAYYLERLEEEGDAEWERKDKLAACRNELEFIIAKQRNGPVQSVKLWCDMACSAVRNGARYGRESGR